MFTDVLQSYPITGQVVKWLSSMVAAFLSFVRPVRPHRGSSPFAQHADALLFQPDVAIALGNINKAIILQKIFEWCEVNRAAGRNYREGFYWTYNTYEKWQQKHFTWLNVDTVRRLLKELEKDGVIVARQFALDTGDCQKWYRVNGPALTRLLKGVGKSSGGVIPLPTASESKTRTGESKRPQQKKASNQITPFQPQEDAPVSPAPAVLEDDTAASTEIETQVTPGLKASQVWSCAAQQLAGHDPLLRAYLQGACLTGYDAAARRYTVSVSSEYVAKQLRHSQRLIVRTVQNLHGEAVAVLFTGQVRAQSA